MKNYNSENAIKLEQAFVELLTEENFSDVKINQITKKAGVNRTSFYVLWGNKDELLEYICANFLTGYTDNMFKHFLAKDENRKKSLLKEAFTELALKEKFIKGIWSVSDASFSPYLKMQEAMEKTVYRSISIIHPEELKESSKILYSKFFSACALATIKWWLDNENERDFEYIQNVINLSSVGFENLLKL